MVKSILLHFSLLATFLAFAACSAEPTESKEQDSVADWVIFDVPMPDERDADRTRPLYISSDGRITFADQLMTASDITDLSRRLRTERWMKVAVLIAEDAPYSQAFEQLQNVSNSTAFELIDLVQHQAFDRASAENGDDIGNLEFKGSLGQYELPVVVDYSSPTDRCVVSLDGDRVASLEGRTLSSLQFYDLSFTWLDGLVKEAGGIEGFIEKTNNVQNVKARIQAKASTPWRCIAGVIHHVKVSGWPSVRLEAKRP